jgi:hypothetical protein
MRRKRLLQRSVFLTLSCVVRVRLYSLRTNKGAAIPGFFADQSVETLDFMMKAGYATTMWTAHVHSCRIKANHSLQSMR